MRRILSALLDIVLPRKKRVARIDDYTIEQLAVTPTTHHVCGVTITTLTSYRTQAAEDLVRALKYDHTLRAAQLLAGMLAEYLREEIASLKTFSARPVLLVPVPLYPSREKERGFNQVERILGTLPREFHDGTLSRVASDALMRIRATQQQTRLSRHERLRNVRDAFSLSEPEVARDAHVILVDDVTTTGATLAEAAKPFQKAKIPITLIALAHA